MTRKIFFQFLIGVCFIMLTASIISCASSTPNSSKPDDGGNDNPTKAAPSFEVIVELDKNSPIDQIDKDIVVTDTQAPKKMTYKLNNKDLFASYSADLYFQSSTDNTPQKVGSIEKHEDGILFTLSDTDNSKDSNFTPGTYSLIFTGTYVSDQSQTDQVKTPKVIIQDHSVVPKDAPSFEIVVNTKEGETLDQTDKDIILNNGKTPQKLVFTLKNKDLFSSYSATLSFKADTESSATEIAESQKTGDGILFTLPDSKNTAIKPGVYSFTFQGTYSSDNSNVVPEKTPLFTYIDPNPPVPDDPKPTPDPDPDYDSGDAAEAHFNSTVIIASNSGKEETVNYKDVKSTNGIYTVKNICAADVRTWQGIQFNFSDSGDTGTMPDLSVYMSNISDGKNVLKFNMENRSGGISIPTYEGEYAYSTSDTKQIMQAGPLNKNYFYYATFQTQVAVDGADKPYRAQSPIIKFTC